MLILIRLNKDIGNMRYRADIEASNFYEDIMVQHTSITMYYLSYKVFQTHGCAVTTYGWWNVFCNP